MVLSQKIRLEDGLLRAIADDPEGAEIPGPRGAALRFLAKFTRRSWEIVPADIAALREAGLADPDIVDLCQMGAIQTLAVNQADGGGIFFPEEGGDAVGHDRSFYAAASEGLTGATADPPGRRPPTATLETLEPAGHVATDLEAAAYRAQAARAEARWGFVPNLLRALSKGRQPSLLPFQQIALELLEAPQSQRLAPRQHAVVRAIASEAARGSYTAPTLQEQLAREGEAPAGWSRETDWAAQRARDARELLIFRFAEKAAWNAYRITEKDAARFRDAGLGDETYLDVLGTVGLQLGIDRIANALGVAADPGALLPAI